MFIFTAKVSRRSAALAAVVLCATVLLLCILLRGCDARSADKRPPAAQAPTNDARVEYLRTLGWEVSPKPVETLRLTLPDELIEPYLSYNAIQLEQGFDLAPYCGETLARYTYAVTNYPGRARGCQIDLYLYGDTVVAGDVVCTGENGFIATLDYPQQR